MMECMMESLFAVEVGSQVVFLQSKVGSQVKYIRW